MITNSIHQGIPPSPYHHYIWGSCIYQWKIIGLDGGTHDGKCRMERVEKVQGSG